MIALVRAPMRLAVAVPPDDRSGGLALIEHLGGNPCIDPDRPDRRVILVAIAKVGPNGEGLKIPGFEQPRQLHDRAHHAGFIASSGKAEVVVEPRS